MKFLRTLACVVFMSSLALAQTNTPTSSSTASDLAEQVKQLRDAVVDAQKQIAEQKQEIRDLKQQLAGKQDVAAISCRAGAGDVVGQGQPAALRRHEERSTGSGERAQGKAAPAAG